MHNMHAGFSGFYKKIVITKYFVQVALIIQAVQAIQANYYLIYKDLFN